MKNKVAAIILGAGKGTRMKSDKPKVLMPVCGKAMINHIIDTLKTIPADDIVTVISPDGDAVKQAVAPYKTCVQSEQLGTGHAVNCARDLLKDFDGTIMVIFGDTPLISKKTFLNSINKVEDGYAVVVLGFRPADPARYGRLVMKGDELERIVEFKDADDEQKAINFCNSGFMAFDGRYLFEILSKIGNKNAAGEFYLTDAVEVAKQMGLKCTAVEGDAEEVASANTLEELALLEQYYGKK
ncbi:MAG: NTP transferase domain-containing protein [Alphaproteobacteria bacterium]|nr:NTP transferase domain-containing protein [Alphaproteobacteria bacterium]MBR3662321.1 NTP transferase domain-containing protein [Alphaproteobacteria bacterium]